MVGQLTLEEPAPSNPRRPTRIRHKKLAALHEARRQAARAILDYCQRADEENTRNLADASRALATAAAALRPLPGLLLNKTGQRSSHAQRQDADCGAPGPTFPALSPEVGPGPIHPDLHPHLHVHLSTEVETMTTEEQLEERVAALEARIAELKSLDYDTMSHHDRRRVSAELEDVEAHVAEIKVRPRRDV
jgi:hypothetical protein